MKVVLFERYDIRFFLYIFYVSKSYCSFNTERDGDGVE